MAESGELENKKKADLKGQIISIIVLTLLLITFWNMLDLALLTFILYNIVGRLQKLFNSISRHGLPAMLVLVLLYLIFFAVLILIVINLIPKIAYQVTEVWSRVMDFDLDHLLATIDPRIAALISDIDFTNYVTSMGGMVSSAAAKLGHFSLNLLFALVLSFFLIAEKEKIRDFGKRLETSKISFIYNYFIDFGGVFARTFGKVMKVQVTIAAINCMISSVCLFFMGFPNIIGLGFMIFCLGLIPVAGVVISLVPLCAIAFTIGGWIKIIEVVIMILVIHAIEAYILNPKLMANRVRLPVCFVFIILLVAEHYLKVWGLLIGVPIFIFLMVILDVNYATEKKRK